MFVREEEKSRFVVYNIYEWLKLKWLLGKKSYKSFIIDPILVMVSFSHRLIKVLLFEMRERWERFFKSKLKSDTSKITFKIISFYFF